MAPKKTSLAKNNKKITDIFKVKKKKNEDKDVIFLSSYLSSTPTLTASIDSNQHLHSHPQQQLFLDQSQMNSSATCPTSNDPASVIKQPTRTASASSLQSFLTSSSTSQLSNSNNSHQINSSSTARRKLFPAIENNHNVC